MSTPAWVDLKFSTVLAADLRLAGLELRARGIFLKALRDTAYITFPGEACYRCIVREYLE